MTELSNEDVFARWAPDGNQWTEWAKPVAFAQLGPFAISPINAGSLPDVLVSMNPAAAVIADLPGALAVYAGLSLARRGYRPVPLFNGTFGPSAIIDVTPLCASLWSGAETLGATIIPPDAPPAFLLDSRRMLGAGLATAGAYDNRWMVLPQDFPSGALLASRGIQSVTLLLEHDPAIPTDLTHVLRRWQEVGLRIHVAVLSSGARMSDVSVPKPSRFRAAWYAAVAILGFRRNNVGGFGSTVPESGGGSGFYG